MSKTLKVKALRGFRAEGKDIAAGKTATLDTSLALELIHNGKAERVVEKAAPAPAPTAAPAATPAPAPAADGAADAAAK